MSLEKITLYDRFCQIINKGIGYKLEYPTPPPSSPGKVRFIDIHISTRIGEKDISRPKRYRAIRTMEHPICILSQIECQVTFVPLSTLRVNSTLLQL